MSSKYRISIRGKNPEYFVKKIIAKNINIYDFDKKAKEVIIVVDSESYKKIKEIKTTYKIKIIERMGVEKYKYLLGKYFIIVISFIIGILLNVILSKMIFEVEVIHPNKVIRELILDDLKEEGIEKYHFKVSYNKKEKIKEKILREEINDLEWLEIEEVGTKYVVKVEQRKKNEKEEVCAERNVVASKSAMILEIEATEGEVVKKKLDYVSKGDILISGLVYNKEEVVAKRCATGKVYGEVWYKVNLELPKNYYEENVTGKKKKQLEVQFLNYTYSLFSTFKTYKKKETPILQSRLLPINISLVTYLETKVIDRDYTLETIDAVAKELAENKLRDKLNKDDQIISKKVLKKGEKESRIIVEVFVKVKEDITAYQDITNINIDELNKKEE